MLTSKCLRTSSAGISKTGAMRPMYPAFEMSISTLAMSCFVFNSFTASAASVADVESSLDGQ